MKCLVVLCGFLALAASERFTGEIDWSQVKSIEEFPHYWARIPQDVLDLVGDNNGAESRVTNGQPAVPNSFPFQVAVLSTYAQGQGLCGGSLISNNYVLTAAHCVQGARGGIVILGAHNINDNSEQNVKITFSQSGYKHHENYNSNTIRNDVAVIRLSESVRYTNKIQPSRLPTRSQAGQLFEGYLGTVSGWGKTSDSAGTSATLRYVSNPIMSNSGCAQYFGTSLVQNQNICKSGDNGRSSCNGDSGGPLTVDGPSGKIQVGVVSFGSASGCQKGYPSVYARVSFFLDWISRNSDVVILP